MLCYCDVLLILTVHVRIYDRCIVLPGSLVPCIAVRIVTVEGASVGAALSCSISWRLKSRLANLLMLDVR